MPGSILTLETLSQRIELDSLLLFIGNRVLHLWTIGHQLYLIAWSLSSSQRIAVIWMLRGWNQVRVHIASYWQITCDWPICRNTRRSHLVIPGWFVANLLVPHCSRSSFICTSRSRHVINIVQIVIVVHVECCVNLILPHICYLTQIIWLLHYKVVFILARGFRIMTLDSVYLWRPSSRVKWSDLLRLLTFLTFVILFRLTDLGRMNISTGRII